MVEVRVGVVVVAVVLYCKGSDLSIGRCCVEPPRVRTDSHAWQSLAAPLQIECWFLASPLQHAHVFDVEVVPTDDTSRQASGLW